MEKKLILQKGREKSIERQHPWIFSGAVKKTIGDPIDGDMVQVVDTNGSIIGQGHYNNGSIICRMLRFDQEAINQDFWNAKVRSALDLRQKTLGLPNTDTNCFRLIHGEGDGLPGLIVDVYNGHVVVQCHSIGMYRNQKEIVEAIKNELGDLCISIYSKSKEVLPPPFHLDVQDGTLWGTELDRVEVSEYQNKFDINWRTGQKTGFFLDQRENRKLLAKYCANKTVLNCFCYTGGFSVYALNAGAQKVVSVDISQKAMDLTAANVAKTAHAEKHELVTANVLEYLKDDAIPMYDIVVVDPPAFAKSISKRHNAIQAYKRLNILAMQKVKPKGLLFTYSCSQVVDNQLFYDTIVAAGIEAKRNVRVLQSMSQGPDHPVNLYHVEGHYLKGLIVYLD